MDDIQPPPKRGRGRPKGVKNRPKPAQPPNVPTPREVPPGLEPFDDYRAPDPLTMVNRHYAMLDWQQQALRQEMKVGLGAKEGVRADQGVGEKLLDVGAALMKAMEAHKRALALAEELSKHKTPQELLEIAIRKIEGQDLPTLEAIIKRLRRKRAELAPVTRLDGRRMGDNMPATDALAALEA
jgi:hypothetical protein